MRLTFPKISLVLALAAAGHASHAQSLQALYDAARGYDAAFWPPRPWPNRRNFGWPSLKA